MSTPPQPDNVLARRRLSGATLADAARGTATGTASGSRTGISSGTGEGGAGSLLTPRDRMMADLEAAPPTVADLAARTPPPTGRPLHERAYLLVQAMTVEERGDGGYQRVADQVGKSVATVASWARRFNWAAKLAAYETEMEQAARAAGRAVIRERASKMADDFFVMASNLLVLTSAVIISYVDPQTNEMRKTVDVREIPPLLRVALECAAAAREIAGSLGFDAATPMGLADWQQALAVVPPDQRGVLLRGLDAARTLRHAQFSAKSTKEA